jgi:hypothetical protein
MSKWYSEPFESYTSNSEFDLAERVWTDNEIPPVDLYAMLPKPMKHDLWAWLIGKVEVIGDVSWAGTDNEEEYDEHGNLLVPAIAKYVNGARAVDFGPQPIKVYNPTGNAVPNVLPDGSWVSYTPGTEVQKDGYEYRQGYLTSSFDPITGNAIWHRGDSEPDPDLPKTDPNYGMSTLFPIYKRIEIEGVIMPEFDFLLHEGYRYLGRTYPTSQKYVELLTPNELDDIIESAAAIIDYKIDTRFLTSIAEDFDYTSIDLNYQDLAKSYEVLKIKIRNLLDHATRRKFFGSESGYQMFAGGVERIVRALPIGRYFPLQDPNDRSNTSRDFDWYVDYQKSPENFSDRRVNRLNEKYLDEFKVVDFRKSTYDYSEPPIVTAETTLYALPTNLFRGFEFRYRAGSTVVTTLGNIDDFSTQTPVKINDEQTTFFTNIDREIQQKTSLLISFNQDGTYSFKNSSVGKTDQWFADSVVEILNDDGRLSYTTMYKYKDMKSSIEDLLPHLDIDWTNYYALFEDGATPGMTVAQNFLFKLEQDFGNKFYDTFDVMPSPYYFGDLISSMDFELKAYDSEPKITYNYSNNTAVIENDSVVENFPIKIGDSISLQLVTDYSYTDLSIVTGILKQQLTFNNFSGAAVVPSALRLETSSPSAGVVLALGDDSGEILMYGKRKTVSISSKYLVDGVTFSVGSIPIVKSPDELRVIYDEAWFEKHETEFGPFNYCSSEKISALTTIFGRGDKLPAENVFKVYKLKAEKINASYLNVNSALNTILSKVRSGSYSSKIDPAYSNDFTKLNQTLSSLAALLEPVTPTDTLRKQFLNSASSKLRNYDPLNKITWINAAAAFSSTVLQAIDEVKTELENKVTVDQKVDYYADPDSEYTKNLSLNQRNALRRITNEIDKTLERMVANRWLLLSPKLSSPWRIEQNPDRSALNSAVKSAISTFYDINPKGNLFGDVKKIVMNGYLMVGQLFDFRPTSISAITVTSSQINVGTSTYSEFLTMENATDTALLYKSFVPAKNVDDKDKYYYELNHTVKEILDTSNHDEHSISYATVSSFDNFVITADDNLPNVIGTTEEITIIKILGEIDVVNSPTIISFTSDQAKVDMRTLSIGDVVRGTGVYQSVDEGEDVATFITKINRTQNTVEVNRPLVLSGSFLLSFECKFVATIVETTEDFYRYRFDQTASGIYDDDSLFRHGLWGTEEWPFVSKSVLSSPLDISIYEEDTINSFRKDQNSLTQFLSITRNVYNTNPPAMINYPGTLLLLVHADRLVDGKTKLMNVGLLDYFENNLSDISRAGDDTIVGVGLTIETDTSGGFSTSEMADYTDSNVHLLARTMSWSERTIPSYIQIGSGRNGTSGPNLNPELAISQPDLQTKLAIPSFRTMWPQSKQVGLQERHPMYKSFWGWDHYDDVLLSRTIQKMKKIADDNSEVLLTLEEFFSNPDRYWNFESKDLPSKYDSVKNVVKFIPEEDLGKYGNPVTYDQLSDDDKALFDEMEKYEAEQLIRSKKGPSIVKDESPNNTKNGKPTDSDPSTILSGGPGLGDTFISFKYNKASSRVSTPGGITVTKPPIAPTGVGQQVIDRSVYYHESFVEYKTSPENIFEDVTDIGTPLFEMRLGEREVFLQSNGVKNELLTIITSMIKKQVYSNVTQKNSTQIITEPNEFISSSLLSIPSSQLYGQTGAELIKSNYTNEVRSGQSSDVEKINFLGLRTMTLEDDRINYPDSSKFTNSELNYFIVSEAAHLKTDELSEDFTAGELIIFDDQKWRRGVGWCGGLYGESSEMMLHLESTSDFEPSQIIMSSTEGPKFFDNENNGNNTIKHALLVKLLYVSGNFQNNQNLRLFTVSELSEVFWWLSDTDTYNVADGSINPGGSIPTDDAFLRDWAVLNYGSRFTREQATINYGPSFNKEPLTREDFYTIFFDGNTQKITTLTTASFYSSFRTDDLFWFYFLDCTNVGAWTALKQTGLQVGTVFALKYSRSSKSMKLFTINTANKAFIDLSQNFLSLLTPTEKSTISGRNGRIIYEQVTTGTPRYVETLPVEIASSFQNIISLPKSKLLKGSVDLKYRIDPIFVSEVYSLKDKSIIRDDISVSTNPIYLNEELKCLVTTDEEGNEWAIKTYDNKYWKNLLYFSAKYQYMNMERNGKSVNVPILTPEDGALFQYDLISSEDRILEISLLTVRSDSSPALEPVFFSSYISLNGAIRGIFQDESDNFFLAVAPAFARGSAYLSKQIEFSATANRLMPIKTENGNTTYFSSEEILFPDAWDDGTPLDAPALSKLRAFTDVVADTPELNFKYFRNALILKGTVNIANPEIISFPSPAAINGLKSLSTGARVLGLAALSSSKATSVTKYDLVNDETGLPFSSTLISYSFGSLAAIDDYGSFFYAEVPAVEALESKIMGKVVTIALGLNQPVASSLAYDPQNSKWIAAWTEEDRDAWQNIVSKGTSRQFAINPAYLGSEEFGWVNPVAEVAGHDVNTNQTIEIVDVWGSGRPGVRAIGDQIASVKARDVAIAFGAVEQKKTLVFEGTTAPNQIDKDGNSGARALEIIGGYFDYPMSWTNVAPTGDFASLNFSIYKRSVTEGAAAPYGNFSLKIINAGVKAYYYNASEEKWVPRNYDDNFLLKDYNSHLISSYSIMIIKSTLGDGEIASLPKPSNLISGGVAIKLSGDSFTVRAESSGPTFILGNPLVLSAPYVDPNGNVLDEYEGLDTTTVMSSTDPETGIIKASYGYSAEGVAVVDDFFNPYQLGPDEYVPVDPEVDEAVTGSRLAATGPQGFQARIIGGALFVFTPTEKVGGGNTVTPHWKWGKLPKSVDVTAEELRASGPDGAYELVLNILKGTIESLNAVTPTNIDPTYDNTADVTKIANTMSAWLTKFLPEGQGLLKKYDSTVSSYVINGLQLFQTNDGIVPYFSSNSSVNTNYDAQPGYHGPMATYDNYFKYLADFSKYALDSEIARDLVASAIKKLWITDSSVCLLTESGDLVTANINLLTTRAAIESPDSWHVSPIDDQYTFVGVNPLGSLDQNGDPIESQVKFKIRQFDIDIDGSRTTSMLNMPVVPTGKGLVINRRWTEGNLIVLGGYAQLGEAGLRSISENSALTPFSVYKKIYPNNGKESSSAAFSFNEGTRFPTYPFFAFSNDGGSSFTSVTVSKFGDILPAIDAFSVDTPNYKAGGIYKRGAEVRLAISETKVNPADGTEKEGETKAVCYIRLRLENGQLVFEENNNEVDAGDKAGENGPSLADSVLEFNAEAYEFHKVSDSSIMTLAPFNFAIDPRQATVSSVNERDIRLSGLTVAAATVAENIEVLISLETNKSVVNQAQFLEFEEKLFNWKGNFKVKEFYEVSSQEQANRLWSRREALPLIDSVVDGEVVTIRGDGDRDGLPAISEDTEFKVYQYGQPYTTTIDGETVEARNYVGATNVDGDPVFLCSDDGRYLKERDSHSFANFVSLRQMITSDVSPYSFPQAPTLAVNADTTIEDENLTPKLLELVEPKIKYLNVTTDSPLIIVDSDTIGDLIDWLISENEVYEWDEDERTKQPGPELSEVIAKYEDKLGNWYTLNNPYWPYPGYPGDPGGEVQYRFEKVGYGDKVLVKDSVLSILPKRTDEQISFQAKPEYDVAEGRYKYNRSFVEYDNSGAIETGMDYKVTGIYMPPSGYGGMSTTASFNEKHPWQIDQLAFSDENMVNPYGDFVKLVDFDGTEAVVDNGYDIHDENEELNISLNSYKNGLNMITAELASDVSKKDSVALYKPFYENYKIYSAFDSIEVNPEDDGDNLGIVGLSLDGKLVGLDRFTYSFSLEDDSPFDLLSLEVLNRSAHSALSNNQFFKIVSKNISGLIEANPAKIIFSVLFDNVTVRKVFSFKGSDARKIKIIDIHETIATDTIVYTEPAVGEYSIKITSDSITFDEETVEINSSSINVVVDSYNVNANDELLIKTTTSKLVNDVYVEVSDADFSEIINLPLLESSEPFAYVIKENYVDESSLFYKVYLGEEDVTNQFSSTITPDSITLSKDVTSFVLPIKKISPNDEYLEINSECFDSNGNLSKLITKERVFVDYIKGKLILKKFIYPTFEALRQILGKTFAGKVLETRESADINRFVSINETFIELANALSDETLNDAKGHAIIIKVLPITSVLLENQTLNSPNYRIEITGDDIDTFSYDRVWINDSSFVPQPIKIGGKYYRTDGFDSYSTENLTNAEGLPVYLANEEGYLVKFSVINNELVEKKLGDDSGDCSADITRLFDRRVISRKPIYDSAYDWFKAEFYTDGTTNPFWQFIHFSENVDSTYQIITPKVSIEKIEKVNDIGLMTPITDGTEYGSIEKTTEFSYSESTLSNAVNIDFLDYSSGTIKFNFLLNNELYKNSEYFINYGIKYKNSFFSQNGELKKVWVERQLIDNYCDYSYSVNSSENIYSKVDKDSAIASITEIGVFDQNHKIIFYSIFPPIEYRSDTQAFCPTIFISNVLLEDK